MPDIETSISRRWFASAWAEFRLSILGSFQYRVHVILLLCISVIEPIVFWAVAGHVVAPRLGAQMSSTGLANYYTLWGIVSVWIAASPPLVWERWIREGRMVAELTRPVPMFVRLVARQAGLNAFQAVLWLPVGVVVGLLIGAQLTPIGPEYLFAVPALALAFLLSQIIAFSLGLMSFWLVRIASLVAVFSAFALVLGGRLLPVELLPVPVQTLAAILPFYWYFGFPIDATTSSPSQTLSGLLVQVAWIAVAALITFVLWRRAVARYTGAGD